MTCGIYLLSFIGTDKVYVGQSKRIETRYRQHCKELVNGTHTLKLLSAYATYGLPTLEIETECLPEELDKYEKYYIDLWDAVSNGFNHSHTPAGGTGRGELNASAKHRDSEIISLINFIVSNPEMSLVEVSNINNISYSIVKNIASGSSYSWLAEAIPETYDKLIELKGTRTNKGERQGSSKYSNLVIETAFNRLLQDITTPNSVIAEEVGVTESVVNAICGGTHYTWLKEKYPEQYAELQSKRSDKRAYSRSAKARGISYPPIISPIDGSIHYIENVNKFAKANGLDTGSLNKVLNKKALSTKGWRLAD